jgi:Fe-S cluster assembly protein SufD
MPQIENYYHNIQKSIHQNVVASPNVERATYFFVDISPKNTNSRLVFNVLANQAVDIYLYIINRNYHKTFDITIMHESNATSNITIRALVNKSGNTVINLKSVAKKDTKQVVANQSIESIIFGEQAKISVLPSMVVDTNKIKATHAVSIGHINPEELFYLMSKGIKRNVAANLIFRGLFTKLAQVNDETGKKLYNSIQTAMDHIAV